MLTMNDIKNGSIIAIDNQPYVILSSQHVQMGRGGAIVRTKMKNMISGQVMEKTYKSGDKINEADLAYQTASFLYQDEDKFYFMDSVSYDQFFLNAANIGEAKKFLKEGQTVKTMLFDERPVSIELPKKIELKVIQTETGTRGDTAQGSVTKPATLETGYKINLPLFVNQGDVIRVNTETGQYVERV